MTITVIAIRGRRITAAPPERRFSRRSHPPRIAELRRTGTAAAHPEQERKGTSEPEENHSVSTRGAPPPEQRAVRSGRADSAGTPRSTPDGCPPTKTPQVRRSRREYGARKDFPQRQDCCRIRCSSKSIPVRRGASSEGFAAQQLYCCKSADRAVQSAIRFARTVTSEPHKSEKRMLFPEYSTGVSPNSGCTPCFSSHAAKTGASAPVHSFPSFSA